MSTQHSLNIMKPHCLILLVVLVLSLQAKAQRTTLWSVKKQGNAHTSYLMGTLHQMGNSFLAFVGVLHQQKTI